MKEPKSKRVIVRLTESQFKSLMEHVAEEQNSVSNLIRESIKNQLNKIKEK